MDLVEAGTLVGREGETFDAVVVDVADKDARRGVVTLREDGVEGTVTSAADLRLGSEVTVRLSSAFVQDRSVALSSTAESGRFGGRTAQHVAGAGQEPALAPLASLAMHRHQLLRRLHDVLRPRTYFEIGVSKGRSLTLSRTRSVGVDPFFEIRRELLCDLHLVRSTSDEFFARPHPLAHFEEPVVDLAFIDGMHLSEYALRDFINTERFLHAASVVVIDDMLPRHPDEAERSRDKGRLRGAWTGDVYKVLGAMREHRPELVCLEMDTKPTGTVVVLAPDPSSTVLADRYDDLVESFVVPDPQDVPDAVLRRSRAIDPRVLLDAPIWQELRRLRELPDPQARPAVVELLSSSGLTELAVG